MCDQSYIYRYIYIYIFCVGIFGFTLVCTIHTMSFSMCVKSYISQSGYIAISVDTPCNSCMCIDMY